MNVHSEIIKRTLQIGKVIEHYTGEQFKNNRIACPFHQDKTPSFFINPKKQYFKCFGCGVGGDLFTFVQLYFGCDFKTAIDILCRDFNISASENTVDIVKESERVRKYKIYIKWQKDTLKTLHDAYACGKEFLELNRPMIDINEITEEYTQSINDLCRLEFYFDEFLKDDKEFYKNYRKEAYLIAGRILSRCDKRQDRGVDIGRAAV